MRTKSFQLPNGFRDGLGNTIREIELRQLDGDEEDLMVDRQELRRGNILNRVLKSCLVRLGSEEDPKKITALYDNYYLLADTHFALVMLRQWSMDPIYRFYHQCPRCEHETRHKLDLRSLTVDQQKEEDRGLEKYIATITDEFAEEGEPNKFVLEWRPLRVKDEVMINAIRQDYPKEKASRELMLPILAINGDKPKLEDLRSGGKYSPMRIRNLFRQTMDSKLGGIDTDLVMECGKCNRSYRDSMPFDVKDFFFPEGDGSETTLRTAIPYRAVGTTRPSSDTTGTGSQAKSESSPSPSASTTSQ